MSYLKLENVCKEYDTRSIDVASAQKVAELLKLASDKYNQTIMVTHDKQVADYADIVFNIVDGSVKC